MIKENYFDAVRIFDSSFNWLCFKLFLSTIMPEAMMLVEWNLVVHIVCVTTRRWGCSYQLFCWNSKRGWSVSCLLKTHMCINEAWSFFSSCFDAWTTSLTQGSAFTRVLYGNTTLWASWFQKMRKIRCYSTLYSRFVRLLCCYSKLSWYKPVIYLGTVSMAFINLATSLLGR